tara:strand:+ start:901 stop:1161 length:261 start_codon:yes stop_codon:yes gene_type:complete
LKPLANGADAGLAGCRSINDGSDQPRTLHQNDMMIGYWIPSINKKHQHCFHISAKSEQFFNTKKYGSRCVNKNSAVTKKIEANTAA